MIFHKHSHQHGVSKRVRILAWTSIISWSLLIVALIVFHYGRPELEYGVLNYFGIEVRRTWLPEYFLWYIGLLSSCSVISLYSLYINRTRVAHKPHRLRFNTVLLLLVCITMILSAINDAA